MSSKHLLRAIGILIWKQPFFTCPVCLGAGGAMEGYYEPEWSECSCCWHYWDELEDLDDKRFEWFFGRASLLQWLRARLSKSLLKTNEALPLRAIARCQIGRHRWVDRVEPDNQICGDCWNTERSQ